MIVPKTTDTRWNDDNVEEGYARTTQVVVSLHHFSRPSSGYMLWDYWGTVCVQWNYLCSLCMPYHFCTLPSLYTLFLLFLDLPSLHPFTYLENDLLVCLYSGTLKKNVFHASFFQNNKTINDQSSPCFSSFSSVMEIWRAERGLNTRLGRGGWAPPELEMLHTVSDYLTSTSHQCL